MKNPILLLAFASLVSLVSAACTPGIPPLAGVPAPDRMLPSLSLPEGHRHIVFRWEFEEGEVAARGDGSVRTAAPDSARLDFFLGGGLGAGAAILIGDSLRAPPGNLVKRYLPPASLMWAALGRLAIPPLPDTVVRVEGDVLRADVGRPRQWRVTTKGDTLVRVDHIAGGSIGETVSRAANGVITYEAPESRRRLRLTIVRENIGSFDATIWSL